MKAMRINLTKEHFTRAERCFGRLLNELRIPFQTKVKINGKEIDFLIGKIAIEIDGHSQKEDKNNNLALMGYTPIHFTNKEVIQGRKEIRNKLINEFDKIKFGRIGK